MMPIPRRATRLARWTILAAALVLLTSRPAAAGPVDYVALGDSVAFGQTNVVPTSYGDQGYVKPFADGLGTRAGGDRPRVINLAIPGELTSTFFSGDTPPGWSRAVSNNLNYAHSNQSQDSLFLSTVAAEKAAGRQINYVSFALGSNDFFYAINDPNFFKQPEDKQKAQLTQTFADMQNNYTRTLTQIRNVLPNATLLLLDYYNPYAVLGPDNPLNQLGQGFAALHRQLITSEAAVFNARVVTISAPFVGHEADYTYILSGNVHPNDVGYRVIADQLIATVADTPEPCSLALLTLGGVGALVLRRSFRA